MKSESRTQLEKFNMRVAKANADTEAILRAELKRKQDMLDSIGTVRSEDLQKKGNIEEAAAVFSYTGLEVFASSFGNTVGRILQENIPTLIHNAVQSEIQRVFDGLLSGVQKRLQDDVQLITKDLSMMIPEIEQSAPESAQEEKKEEAPVIVRPKKRRMTYERSEMLRKDAHDVAMLLQMSEDPVKLKDIIISLPHINFTTQPTSKMTNMIRHEPNIISAGYGKYTYKNQE